MTIITLHAELLPSFSGQAEPEDRVLIFENKQIKFKTKGCLERLLCCCSCYPSKKQQREEARKSFNAFKQYLEKEYEKSVARAAIELSKPLLKTRDFRLKQAIALKNKAQELNPRYGDIKLFLIWLNWHKAYRKVENLKAHSVEFEPSGNPPNPVPIDRDAAQRYFQLYLKPFKQIPIEGIPKEALDSVVEQAYKNLYETKHQKLLRDFATEQEEILIELKKRGGSVKPPPVDIIPLKLKEEIETFETTHQLTSEHWEELLKRKADYMPYRPSRSLVNSITRSKIEIRLGGGDERPSQLLFSSMNSDGL